jgi:hypothetical protein
MIAGQYHCCRSLNIQMNVSVVQTDPQYLVSFFLCSLGLGYKVSDEIFIRTLYNPSLKI